MGDTIFNGIHYSKCYSAMGLGGIRNDTLNKKVYLYSTGTGTEKLLYDFNMAVGDTVYSNSGFGFYTSLLPTPHVPPAQIDTAWISRIDSILMPHDGLYHKRFNFNAKIKNPGSSLPDILINSDSNGPFNGVNVKINPLIEGVGQLYGSMSEYSFFEYHWISKIFCSSINGAPIIPTPLGSPKNPVYNSKSCNSLFNGIEEKNIQEKFNISPNPSNGKFQLTLNDLQSNAVEITDVLGKIIYKSEIKNTTTEINLSNAMPGIYFVRLNDVKGNNVVKKIVKE
ncbi:MAG: T9SS type A sorting domain-containing protein [Bacteroidetes bacterium]|nr:T9SS type A sorting domain-containing protein [Bacteroidota bacterium]